MSKNFVDKNQLNSQLFGGLSDMYSKEVPLYAQLYETNLEINLKTIASNPEKYEGVDPYKLSNERHGAIRLASEEEFQMMTRFFKVMGMYPNNMYDLTSSQYGAQPGISTAFMGLEDINHRMFCTLVLPETLEPKLPQDLLDEIKEAVSKRKIFPDELIKLIEKSEQRGGLEKEDADRFVELGTKVFEWKGKCENKELYDKLKDLGFGIIADATCFPNPHLNHLTPNSLDIDECYEVMSKKLGNEYKDFKHRGMKDSIEGYPLMQNLMLLRQTSFNALEENVVFVDKDGVEHHGKHTARFGELEQRGTAVTKEGMDLYYSCIGDAIEVKKTGIQNTDYEAFKKQYADCFAKVPDDLVKQYEQSIIYVDFKATEKGKKELSGKNVTMDLDSLIEKGYVEYAPSRYNHFLPISAAGIFGSNDKKTEQKPKYSVKPQNFEVSDLERIIKAKVVDMYDLAEAQKAQSIKNIYDELGVKAPFSLNSDLEKAIKNDPRKQFQIAG